MAIFLPGTAEDQALSLDEMTPREIVAELDKHGNTIMRAMELLLASGRRPREPK